MSHFMPSLFLSRLLAPSLIVFLWVACSPVWAGDTIKCCIDDNGARRCSDLLPRICHGRAYQILDSSGNILQRVAPPLSKEERSQKESEDQTRRQQKLQAYEQKRKDRALLETYPTLQDLENARDDTLFDLNEEIRAAEEGIKLAESRRKGVKPDSPIFKQQESQIRTLNEVITARRREYEQVKVRFAEDRNRYIELSEILKSLVKNPADTPR